MEATEQGPELSSNTTASSSKTTITQKKTASDTADVTPDSKKPAAKTATRKTAAAKTPGSEKPADSKSTAKAKSPRTGKSKIEPRASAAINEEQRRQLIATAAYLRAEKRGFNGGNPTDDWLQAEAEVDAMLGMNVQ